MTTRAQATAAPIDVEIAGRTLSVSPLTDSGIAELDNWLRARVVRIARDSLNGAPPEQREETMKEAFRYAASLSWVKDPDQLINTPDGIIRFALQLAKGKHPDLTLQEMIQLIAEDPDGLARIMDAFRVLDEAGKKGQIRPWMRGQPERRRKKRRRRARKKSTMGKYSGS